MTIPIEVLAGFLAVLLAELIRQQRRVNNRLVGLEKKFDVLCVILEEKLGIEISSDTDHITVHRSTK